MTHITKKALTEYAKGKSKLVKSCIEIVKSHIEPGYSDGWMEDLLQHGCVSGMVSDLIYTGDCVDFFKKHKTEILDLLENLMQDLGIKSPAELFGDKWEGVDLAIKDRQNQNLLAWFGFEETCRTVASDLGLDV